MDSLIELRNALMSMSDDEKRNAIAILKSPATKEQKIAGLQHIAQVSQTKMTYGEPNRLYTGHFENPYDPSQPFDPRQIGPKAMPYHTAAVTLEENALTKAGINPHPGPLEQTYRPANVLRSATSGQSIESMNDFIASGVAKRKQLQDEYNKAKGLYNTKALSPMGFLTTKPEEVERLKVEKNRAKEALLNFNQNIGQQIPSPVGNFVRENVVNPATLGQYDVLTGADVTAPIQTNYGAPGILGFLKEGGRDLLKEVIKMGVVPGINKVGGIPGILKEGLSPYGMAFAPFQAALGPTLNTAEKFVGKIVAGNTIKNAASRTVANDVIKKAITHNEIEGLSEKLLLRQKKLEMIAKPAKGFLVGSAAGSATGLADVLEGNVEDKEDFRRHIINSGLGMGVIGGAMMLPVSAGEGFALKTYRNNLQVKATGMPKEVVTEMLKLPDATLNDRNLNTPKEILLKVPDLKPHTEAINKLGPADIVAINKMKQQHIEDAAGEVFKIAEGIPDYKVTSNFSFLESGEHGARALNILGKLSNVLKKNPATKYLGENIKDNAVDIRDAVVRKAGEIEKEYELTKPLIPQNADPTARHTYIAETNKSEGLKQASQELSMNDGLSPTARTELVKPIHSAVGNVDNKLQKLTTDTITNNQYYDTYKVLYDEYQKAKMELQEAKKTNDEVTDRHNLTIIKEDPNTKLAAIRESLPVEYQKKINDAKINIAEARDRVAVTETWVERAQVKVEDLQEKLNDYKTTFTGNNSSRKVAIDAQESIPKVLQPLHELKTEIEIELGKQQGFHDALTTFENDYAPVKVDAGEPRTLAEVESDRKILKDLYKPKSEKRLQDVRNKIQNVMDYSNYFTDKQVEDITQKLKFLRNGKATPEVTEQMYKTLLKTVDDGLVKQREDFERINNLPKTIESLRELQSTATGDNAFQIQKIIDDCQTLFDTREGEVTARRDASEKLKDDAQIIDNLKTQEGLDLGQSVGLLRDAIKASDRLNNRTQGISDGIISADPTMDVAKIIIEANDTREIAHNFALTELTNETRSPSGVDPVAFANERMANTIQAIDQRLSNIPQQTASANRQRAEIETEIKRKNDILNNTEGLTQDMIAESRTQIIELQNRLQSIPEVREEDITNLTRLREDLKQRLEVANSLGVSPKFNDILDKFAGERGTEKLNQELQGQIYPEGRPNKTVTGEGFIASEKPLHEVGYPPRDAATELQIELQGRKYFGNESQYTPKEQVVIQEGEKGFSIAREIPKTPAELRAEKMSQRPKTQEEAKPLPEKLMSQESTPISKKSFKELSKQYNDLMDKYDAASDPILKQNIEREMKITRSLMLKASETHTPEAKSEFLKTTEKKPIGSVQKPLTDPVLERMLQTEKQRYVDAGMDANVAGRLVDNVWDNLTKEQQQKAREALKLKEGESVDARGVALTELDSDGILHGTILIAKGENVDVAHHEITHGFTKSLASRNPALYRRLYTEANKGQTDYTEMKDMERLTDYLATTRTKPTGVLGEVMQGLKDFLKKIFKGVYPSNAKGSTQWLLDRYRRGDYKTLFELSEEYSKMTPENHKGLSDITIENPKVLSGINDMVSGFIGENQKYNSDTTPNFMIADTKTKALEATKPGLVTALKNLYVDLLSKPKWINFMEDLTIRHQGILNDSKYVAGNIYKDISKGLTKDDLRILADAIETPSKRAALTVAQEKGYTAYRYWQAVVEQFIKDNGLGKLMDSDIYLTHIFPGMEAISHFMVPRGSEGKGGKPAYTFNNLPRARNMWGDPYMFKDAEVQYTKGLKKLAEVNEKYGKNMTKYDVFKTTKENLEALGFEPSEVIGLALGNPIKDPAVILAIHYEKALNTFSARKFLASIADYKMQDASGMDAPVLIRIDKNGSVPVGYKKMDDVPGLPKYIRNIQNVGLEPGEYAVRGEVHDYLQKYMSRNATTNPFGKLWNAGLSLTRQLIFINQAIHLPNIVAEAHGLTSMLPTGLLRIPSIYFRGKSLLQNRSEILHRIYSSGGSTHSLQASVRPVYDGLKQAMKSELTKASQPSFEMNAKQTWLDMLAEKNPSLSPFVNLWENVDNLYVGTWEIKRAQLEKTLMPKLKEKYENMSEKDLSFELDKATSQQLNDFMGYIPEYYLSGNSRAILNNFLLAPAWNIGNFRELATILMPDRMLRGMLPEIRDRLRVEYAKTLTSQFISLGVAANIANMILSPRHNTIVQDYLEGNRPAKRLFDIHVGKDSANRDTYLKTPFYRVVHDMVGLVEAAGDFRYGPGQGFDTMWNFISNKIHPQVTNALETAMGFRNIRGPQKWQPIITPGATPQKALGEVAGKAIQNTFIPTYIPEVSVLNKKQDPFGSPLGSKVKTWMPWAAFYEAHDRAGGPYVEKYMEQRTKFDSERSDKTAAFEKAVKIAIRTGVEESYDKGKQELDDAIKQAIYKDGVSVDTVKDKLMKIGMPSKLMRPRRTDYINSSVPPSKLKENMTRYEEDMKAYQKQFELEWQSPIAKFLLRSSPGFREEVLRVNE